MSPSSPPPRRPVPLIDIQRNEPQKLCIFVRVTGKETVAAQAMLFDLDDGNAVYAPLTKFMVTSTVCQAQVEGRELFNIGVYATGTLQVRVSTHSHVSSRFSVDLSTFFFLPFSGQPAWQTLYPLRSNSLKTGTEQLVHNVSLK